MLLTGLFHWPLYSVVSHLLSISTQCSGFTIVSFVFTIKASEMTEDSTMHLPKSHSASILQKRAIKTCSIVSLFSLLRNLKVSIACNNFLVCKNFFEFLEDMEDVKKPLFSPKHSRLSRNMYWPYGLKAKHSVLKLGVLRLGAPPCFKIRR